MKVIPEKPSPTPPDPDPPLKDEDEDEDDGQWSDWEHPIEVPPSPSIKPLQLVTNIKSKWNPNAPLGSEYEIPPLAPPTTTTSNVDDFFKDMTPQVQTVQLMQQLETMFQVDTGAVSTPTSKFGILPSDPSDEQEGQSASNWDD